MLQFPIYFLYSQIDYWQRCWQAAAKFLDEQFHDLAKHAGQQHVFVQKATGVWALRHWGPSCVPLFQLLCFHVRVLCYWICPLSPLSLTVAGRLCQRPSVCRMLHHLFETLLKVPTISFRLKGLKTALSCSSGRAVQIKKKSWSPFTLCFPANCCTIMKTHCICLILTIIFKGQSD